MWQQTLITLRPRPRGFHLVTEEILDALPELRRCRVGLLHLLLQHTSASLTLNENADPAVRRDFERFFERLAPRGEVGYEHNDEGPDDLPAHFKASLLGCQLTLPIQSGGLALAPGRGSISVNTGTGAGHGACSPPGRASQYEFFPAALIKTRGWAITNLLLQHREVDHERRRTGTGRAGRR